MKFSTKGPKEKEKKEKRKSIADKGIIIGKGWQLRPWQLAFKGWDHHRKSPPLPLLATPMATTPPYPIAFSEKTRT